MFIVIYKVCDEFHVALISREVFSMGGCLTSCVCFELMLKYISRFSVCNCLLMQQLYETDHCYFSV
jgi:hypothetical protein